MNIWYFSWPDMDLIVYRIDYMNLLISFQCRFVWNFKPKGCVLRFQGFYDWHHHPHFLLPLNAELNYVLLIVFWFKVFEVKVVSFVMSIFPFCVEVKFIVPKITKKHCLKTTANYFVLIKWVTFFKHKINQTMKIKCKIGTLGAAIYRDCSYLRLGSIRSTYIDKIHEKHSAQKWC